MMRFHWFDLLRFAAASKVQDGIVPEPASDQLPFATLCGAAKVLDHRLTPRTGRGRAKGTRDLLKITGIMLHQTAAPLATADRFIEVPSHAGVPLDASCVLLHPVTAYMWHGHAGNSFTLGIEVGCRADGIDGDARTFWRSKKEKNGYTDKKGRKRPPKVRTDLRVEATDAQIDTTRALVRYYVDEVARLCAEAQVEGGIKVIMAHRQTARKSSDPGSRLWKGVGQWSMDELGLKEGPVLRPGSKLPTAWTGRGEERYNHRVDGF